MTAHAGLPHFSTAANFRDIGGVPTLCGKRVRTGLLYRSEAFDILSEQDIAGLAAHNIQLVCDLRSDSERERYPNLWPGEGAAACLGLNITADLRASHSAVTELLTDNPSVEDARQAMLTTYRLLPAAFVQPLPAFFQAVCQAQLPVVFHCAAGKDRTGFVAALLLKALNVSGEHIFHDYLLSNHYWRGKRATAAIENYLRDLCEAEPSAAVVDVLCGVHPQFLATAFDTIDEQFGSLDAYFNLIGLTPERIQALRGLCLE